MNDRELLIEDELPKAPDWRYITQGAASKHSVVNEHQMNHFVELANALELAVFRLFDLEDRGRIPSDQFQKIWDLQEYNRFILGASACGFVCNDGSLEGDLDAINSRPDEHIGRWSFPELRHYVHLLVRGEKWADGCYSPILDAIRSGALANACNRLSTDENLYEREPVEEHSCLEEPFWTASELRFRRLAKLNCVTLPSRVLHDGNACFALANRLRRDISCCSPFDAVRLLRSCIGALHIESGKTAGEIFEDSAAMASTKPSGNPAVRRSTRLLAMVHELHKAGYQLLRVACGWDPDGLHWRVRLMPASATSEDGWSPISTDHRADHSSDKGADYFGWSDAASDDARVLANKFLARFPDLARLCVGEDWPYAGWFALALGRAECGDLPAFYGGGELTDDDYLPPPPLGVADGNDPGFASPTGFKLIPNDELTVADLPPAKSSYERIWPFCLTYDGYKGGLISIEDCWKVAEKVEQIGMGDANLNDLRTVAYIHQRKLKFHSDMQTVPDDHPSLVAIQNVVEELRRRLSS